MYVNFQFCKKNMLLKNSLQVSVEMNVSNITGRNLSPKQCGIREFPQKVNKSKTTKFKTCRRESINKE